VGRVAVSLEHGPPGGVGHALQAAGRVVGDRDGVAVGVADLDQAPGGLILAGPPQGAVALVGLDEAGGVANLVEVGAHPDELGRVAGVVSGCQEPSSRS